MDLPNNMMVYTIFALGDVIDIVAYAHGEITACEVAKSISVAHDKEKILLCENYNGKSSGRNICWYKAGERIEIKRCEV